LEPAKTKTGLYLEPARIKTGLYLEPAKTKTGLYLEPARTKTGLYLEPAKKSMLTQPNLRRVHPANPLFPDKRSFTASK